MSESTNNPPKQKDASKPRKRVVGRTTRPAGKTGGGPVTTIGHQIPTDILNDPELNAAIQFLPANYSFEIHKTIHQIRKNSAKLVALQMPEGLLMYACAISDIIERFALADTVIMGDVTYGACCIDDYTAVALGCDMMVHYGHSCLVPIDTTTIKTLYVFVEIGIDNDHLSKTIRKNLPSDRQEFRERFVNNEEELKLYPPGTRLSGAPRLQLEAPSSTPAVEGPTSNSRLNEDPQVIRPSTKLALVSTIQFVAGVQKLHEDLNSSLNDATAGQPSPETLQQPSTVESESSKDDLRTSQFDIGRYEIVIPRSKPLSPGEILGCTAPRLPPDVDALVYVGDGRFHLESIMIANPEVAAFRYDPYSKKLTREWYDHAEMQSIRSQAVREARKTINQREGSEVAGVLAKDEPLWGVVLGTLGRQGNFNQLQRIMHKLATHTPPIPFMPILLSELSPAKLSLFPSSHISTFIQTSCPRLSIDWGYAFPAPLLSPYEASVTIGEAQSWEEKEGGTGIYPMDFYESTSSAALARRFDINSIQVA